MKYLIVAVLIATSSIASAQTAPPVAKAPPPALVVKQTIPLPMAGPGPTTTVKQKVVARTRKFRSHLRAIVPHPFLAFKGAALARCMR